MTINEFSCDRPEVTFSFRHHRVFSHLEEELEKRVRLTFLEEYLVLLLRSGRSQVNVDVLRRCSPRKICTVPSANGGVQMRPSAPVLECLRSMCLLSRFSPRTMQRREIYLARLLLQN